MTPQPISLTDDAWAAIDTEFATDRAMLFLESTCVSAPGGKAFVDEQVGKAVEVSFVHDALKQLLASGLLGDLGPDNQYLGDWTFLLNEDYVIGIHSRIEHFFKIESPYWTVDEKSPHCIDALRAQGAESVEDLNNAAADTPVDGSGQS